MSELLDFLSATFEVFISGLKCIGNVTLAIPAVSYHLVNSSINYVLLLGGGIIKIASSIGRACKDISSSIFEFLQVLCKLLEVFGVLATYFYKALFLLLTVSEYLLTQLWIWSKVALEHGVMVSSYLWKNWKEAMSTLSVKVLALMEDVLLYTFQGLKHILQFVLEKIHCLVCFVDNRWRHMQAYLIRADTLSPDEDEMYSSLLHGAVVGVTVLGFLTLIMTFLHYLHKHNCTFPLFSFFSRENDQIHQFTEIHHQAFDEDEDDSDSLMFSDTESSSEEDSSEDEDGDDIHRGEEFEIDEFSDSDSEEEANVEINISQERRAQRRYVQRHSESGVSSPAELRRRLEEEEDSRLCVVCSDAAKSVLVLPCKHVCLCTQCAVTIATLPNVRRLCPLCRSPITEVLDVFI